MLQINFETIDYLKDGNDRQKNAYAVLNQAEIFKKLQAFNPLLVGTIPIAIDIETSDLDIVCYCRDQKAFSECLKDSFGHFSGFRIWQNPEMKAALAGFNAGNFHIEIFGQNIPTRDQAGYRHLVVEYAILQKKGIAFRDQVIALKRQGYKTEPAFAKLLGLDGDPYQALLVFDSACL